MCTNITEKKKRNPKIEQTLGTKFQNNCYFFNKPRIYELSVQMNLDCLSKYALISRFSNHQKLINVCAKRKIRTNISGLLVVVRD